MKTRIYNGPHGAGDLLNPDHSEAAGAELVSPLGNGTILSKGATRNGSEIRVSAGQSIEVSDELADLLDAQGDTWLEPDGTSAANKEAHKRAKGLKLKPHKDASTFDIERACEIAEAEADAEQDSATADAPDKEPEAAADGASATPADGGKE